MKFSSLLVLFPFVLRVFAGPTGQIVLQDTAFDVAQIPAEYALNEQRLLEFEDGSKVWMTELEKLKLKAGGARFFDITDTQDLGFRRIYSSPPSITSFKYNETVSQVIKTLSTEGPKANLKEFSAFYNRYYRSSTGRDSQKWLLGRINEITNEFAASDIRELISIKEFSHPWAQSSIIVRIEGDSASDEVVILGAHQDSTALLSFLAAPGADDDGSGTVTILEAYRALIANNVKPNKTVEFHWYSAEEGGLLGSQAIAQQYSRDSANVVAMIQMDMTAWVKKGTKEVIVIYIWFHEFLYNRLTQTLRGLVKAYTDLPYADTQCGYGCSDHESTFEDMNPNIHSGRDTIDVSPEFSFEHMLEFSKLAFCATVLSASVYRVTGLRASSFKQAIRIASLLYMDHRRRREQADRAHEIQIKSGTYSHALELTLFLIGTIFGLMVGADTALLRYELDQRIVDDRLRREARIELSRQGKIGTEPEIARWIAQKEEAEIFKRRKEKDTID
ncbi:hypothetical protein Clacol_001573 [Clathrus columnatus]|uniref:Peptide hydrolase n=1 Tax=Clathrus columnatus TaxID=1419009 RepID=A0AAV5A444_9AGAM|nr:hypothetical protein Clacol_001573 [Clathrus columnatus]